MEKHNPNSHERPKSWSDLPPDLVNLVFERLSFANFRRAKSVCSSWYAASRQSLPKNQIHWLILFPQDNNSDNSSCTLFNPEEEDKLYKTRDLGAEFAKSVCRATFGSWLLMLDASNNNIYIVNLFTHERINLPHLELLLKDYESRTSHHKRTKYRGRNIRSPPVFWIDEKTKDYVVVLGFRDWCVFYSKKGDSSWNQIPQTSDCFDYFDIVYKDCKLYFLSNRVRFKIFDLSGEIPQQTFQCVVRTHMFHGLGPQLPNCHQLSNSWLVAETKFVVTVTGDVLKVERMLRPRSGIQSFRVYKVYSSSGFYKNEEKVDSLGDESMLFDQGITVLANDPAGFIPNSIYFSNNYRSNYNDYYGKDTKYIYIFNLETQKTEPLHTFDSSSFKFSRTQWFVPSFTHT